MPRIRQPRFPDAIKAVCQLNTIELVASVCNVHRQQVESWCTGKKPLPIPYARLIAVAFGHPEWVHQLRPDHFGPLVHPQPIITPRIPTDA